MRLRSARLPTRSDNSDRSIVTICDALATESHQRLVDRDDSRILPGASASRRLLVSSTQTTVCDMTSVEGVALDNHYRASKAWSLAGRVGEIRPPTVALLERRYLSARRIR